MKPQTVQIVRQGEATLYWFLLIHYIRVLSGRTVFCPNGK
ncbi:IS1106 transposase [Neisseria meningitidis]|nr:hypothetical protein NMEN98008_0765 [Neisseria meningitidis 98008]EOB42577.1 hypothetical protein NM69176_0820 [Neisseria meningitidis 69176]EOB43072.1 hypothetical protein NM70021_0722 [Neisseria meningitidis 70021]EOB73084.1 hypothetical protein NM97027_0765 [Neisseria meningitidis 97027]EOC13058.1 hypothetical protein NM73696_0855 [Neisseria meningitidis 73696]CWQ44592.1 IS1106 transposase [Neisseria meningitidis]